MQQNSPKVTFLVPCYRLSHLLPECINSILAQSYQDFEILILDDCSPDDTPAVAASFGDSRVIHIHNEQNLGNINNYNKGISLARGEYVWLISADDRLRKPYLLHRYVELMEKNPQVGYVFCPVIGLVDGSETDILPYVYHGTEDKIIDGRVFLRSLLSGNSVSAPSAMVRKACYDKISVFPAMPFSGDWYLWSVFALHADVAYLAEPMVNYRSHNLNLTKVLRKTDRRIVNRDEFAAMWKIKGDAEKAGYPDIAKACEEAIIGRYASKLEPSEDQYSEEDLEKSLFEFVERKENVPPIMAQVLTTFANNCYRKEAYSSALEFYRKAIRINPWRPGIWSRYLSVILGKPGKSVRLFVGALRNNS
jgi:glycosyltransferase involved in cell wall biosynthesis